MKRVVVVGSSEYLGTAVTSRASQSYKVLATFRKTPCLVTNLNTDHVRLDFGIDTTVEDFKNLIRKDDVVILASNVEHGQPNDIVISNYEGFLQSLVDRGAKTVYVSSDAIFDGKAQFYTEESIPNPITHYGRRKLRAERIIGDSSNCIIRTSYLYGSNGYTVDKRLLELDKAATEGKAIFRHKNLIRNPIHVEDLANALLQLKDQCGIFHVAGPTMSVYDFSHFLAEEAGIAVSIKEVGLSTEESARIPMNTNLVSIKLQGLGINISSMADNRGMIYLGSRANYA